MLLDYYSASGVGLEHYTDQIDKREREHGWGRGNDYVPHDAKMKEWGSGSTRVETMQSLGLRPMLVPAATIEDGINAARRTLPLCVFHPRCEAGMAALEQYRREWDDDKKAFRASPLHDWTCTRRRRFPISRAGLAVNPDPVIVAAERDGWRIPPPAEPRKGMHL